MAFCRDNGNIAMQHNLRQSVVRQGRNSMPAVAKARAVAPLKDLYGIGEIPPLGHVPEKMHAWVIRKERHGPPARSRADMADRR
jgi:hypothetical protein